MTNSSLNGSIKADIDDKTISILLLSSIALEGLLIVASTWILACMIAYGTKTNKWRRKTDEPFLNNRTLFIVCIIAVALTIPRFVWSIAIIQIPRFKESDELCEVIMDITGITFSIATCPAYLFLWLRQRALYTRPTIRKLTGRWANIFSWTLMAVLTIGSIVMIVIVQAPKSYFAVRQGCLFRQDVGYRTNFYVLAGLLVGSQFSLLCLFIYPMVKTKQTRKRSDSKISCQNEIKSLNERKTRFPTWFSVKGNGKRKRPGVLEKTIRRTIASTIVAVVSDVTTMAVAYCALPPTLPIGVAVALYDVSILINIFCILATFASHRRILLVLCGSLKNTHDWQTDTEHSDKRSKRVIQPVLTREFTE